MYARKPATPPDASLTPTSSQSRYIIFRHPGYDDARNILLRLYASDTSRASSSSSFSTFSRFGLHAGYALAACGIVAGNRWDGWLSEHPDHHGDGDNASSRITFDAAYRHQMLDKHSYYFHLPDEEDGDDDAYLPYPIVPTFREWPFPHEQLPPSWALIAPLEPFEQSQLHSVSGLTTALRQRDVTCRVSGYREGLQAAHICPQAEEDWYLRNGMPRYSSANTESVDNPANALLLRADLHIAFDRPSFVFVPKPADGRVPKFVLHLLEASQEFENLYHNREMQGLGVSVELLFARFAWTIFPMLAGFLKGKTRRRLQLDTMINEENGQVVTPFFASAAQCEGLVTRRSKSRTSSPKKRGRPEDDVTEAETSSPREREQQQRPRKRHRSASSARHLATIEAGTVDAPSSNEVVSPMAPGSLNDADVLRQEWVRRERMRSDPEQRWEEEIAWAADVYKGHVMLGSANAKRWVEFTGGEELEEQRLLESPGQGRVE